MKWAEGHDWVASFSLPPGSYLFKCVVVHEDGTAGEWEGGANRTLQVAESCSWQIISLEK